MRNPPEVYSNELAKLSPDEKGQLREFISSPLYLKMLSMAAVFKPSSNVHNAGSRERDAFSDARANARLGEIRGWEQYHASIFLVLNEPQDIKKYVEETFPDSGRIDADWETKPVRRKTK